MLTPRTTLWRVINMMEVRDAPGRSRSRGHQRQPVTTPGYHAGRPPRNQGQRYPADPPTVEEIIAVMRTAGERADGARLRALIVVLLRAGLRTSEALELAESDMNARRRAVLVRRGKGNKRREVGMDAWAWEQLKPWQEIRAQLPVGAFFCVIHGPTAGRCWGAASAPRQLARTAAAAGVRRRFAPRHRSLLSPTATPDGLVHQVPAHDRRASSPSVLLSSPRGNTTKQEDQSSCSPNPGLA